MSFIGENIVFVHVARTGGTSVKSALKRVVNGYEIKRTHLDAKDVMSMSDAKGKFSFSTVRNPYTRVVSFYQHLWGKGRADKILEAIEDQGRVRPCYDQLTDRKGEFLVVDDVLRFEDLNNEFKEKICPVIGTNIDLSVLNGRSEEKLSKEMENNLPREVIDHINEKYHDDFVNFGYQKI